MLTQLKKRDEPGSDKAVDDKVEAAVEDKEEVGDGREDEHPSWEAVHCLFVLIARMKGAQGGLAS